MKTVIKKVNILSLNIAILCGTILFLFLGCNLIPNKNSKNINKVIEFVVIETPNLGDQSQSLGIINALHEKNISLPKAKRFHIKKKVIKFKDLLAKNYSFSTWKTQQKNKIEILILTGNEGLEVLNNVDVKKIYSHSLWLGHSFHSSLKNLKFYPHWIFIPKTSIKSEEFNFINQHTNLVTLDGVCHQLTEMNLKKSVLQYSRKNPSLNIDDNTVGIILGGDSIDENGKPLLFTPNDARQLAKRIVLTEGKNKKFLITNNHRTGITNYKTKKLLKNDPHNSNKIDKVSKSFIEQMKALNVDYKFFDFQRKKGSSVYTSFINGFRKSGKLHICGDSTSIIAETSDFMHVIVNEIPSMNQTHYRFSNYNFKLGKVDLLKTDGKIYLNNKPNHLRMQASLASHKAANIILNKVSFR